MRHQSVGDDNGLVLGQAMMSEKSNEITAVPGLLRVLELAGCIVTLDAMGSQKNIAKEIKEADADYVVALKGNQGTSHCEAQEFLDAAVAESKTWLPPRGKLSSATARLAVHMTVEKDHWRLETRVYYRTRKNGKGFKRWEWWRRHGKSRARKAWRGVIFCRLPLAQKLAQAIRSHWGMENKVHWIMDVQYGEDQSRTRSGYAAENLAALRRLALNLLKAEKTKSAASEKNRTTLLIPA